jgi:thiamine biosynthesis protein ThiI
VFLPEHPVIKPKLEKVLKEESRLNVESLIEEAINNIEVVDTKNM